MYILLFATVGSLKAAAIIPAWKDNVCTEIRYTSPRVVFFCLFLRNLNLSVFEQAKQKCCCDPSPRFSSVSTVHQDLQVWLACGQLQVRGVFWRLPPAPKVSHSDVPSGVWSVKKSEKNFWIKRKKKKNQALAVALYSVGVMFFFHIHLMVSSL